MLSIPFSVRLGEGSMCQEPYLLIWSPLSLMKLELGLIGSFFIQNSLFLGRKMRLTILPEDIILVCSFFFFCLSCCVCCTPISGVNWFSIVSCSWQGNCRFMPWSSKEIGRQLHWFARVFGLQCCWWWNWFWFGFLAVRTFVCGLWKEIKAWVHHLSFSTGRLHQLQSFIFG